MNLESSCLSLLSSDRSVPPNPDKSCIKNTNKNKASGVHSCLRRWDISTCSTFRVLCDRDLSITLRHLYEQHRLALLTWRWVLPLKQHWHCQEGLLEHSLSQNSRLLCQHWVLLGAWNWLMDQDPSSSHMKPMNWIQETKRKHLNGELGFFRDSLYPLPVGNIDVSPWSPTKHRS